MGRAIGCYDFAANARDALEAMTDAEVDSVLLHEKGELLAGERLGSDWEAMLSRLPRSGAEIMARGVRDHLADSLSTLPALVEDGADAPLHFYFANLTSMRKHLFPRLVDAYRHWLESGRREALADLVPESAAHWESLAKRMLHIHRAEAADLAPSLQDLIEKNRL